MNRKIMGFMLLLAIGFLAMMSFWFFAPILKEKQRRETSDARTTKGTLTVGMDNWVGYFPLCSDIMKRRMRQAGYLLKCLDDNANYDSRMRELGKGNLHFAVATVDSGILNSAAYDFPGTIIAVIDESKGGDAVVVRKNVISSLDDLKSKDFKVVFTPNSPSEHLLKSIGVHFDIPKLREKGEWSIETNGSSEALKKFLAGAADVAVLWEPDVSRALANSGVEKLLGTENTNKLIVDILMVNRNFSINQPDVVQLLLSHYFRTLKEYRDNPDRFKQDVSVSTNLPGEAVEMMLKGVSWVNLNDNATMWFGINSPGNPSQEGLIETIESTVSILINTKDFTKNPLPSEDPYTIVNSSFIKQLFETGVSGQFGDANVQSSTAIDSLQRKFVALNDNDWTALRTIGTLKVRPIVFQSGTSALHILGKQEIDKAAENLRHYPNFRVVIKGHTGLKGDEEANKKLSLERAEAVARYVMVTYGVDENRLRVIGMGLAEPLPKNPGESDRAYNSRLPRVELFLVSEVY